eukprot:CAMPEP_0182469086 /NCGR_PEP_ID=MMETSP1319-20130603/16524_1 /TAXON_ID=172717 /ORGANISM="Bolidomonas pacifica, Strain RCC208" /LENGTH=212 /DNA_ID=CAMNT_0024669353 /DNA_START=155 /DNA_END=789 /DNA_ORIENTATION=+
MKRLSLLALSFRLVQRGFATAPNLNTGNLPPTLNNRFFGMRHGNSLANQARVISSDPAVATVSHGLSSLGVEQANASAAAFVASQSGSSSGQLECVVVSSDFTRARMTAEILLSTLKSAGLASPSSSVRLSTSLRERSFGDLDGGPDTEYSKVWDLDSSDSSHSAYNVEPVDSVVCRTTELCRSLDMEGEGRAIFLVAHGDVLQILQTAFKG